jgi:enoyl-CoA hydratase
MRCLPALKLISKRASPSSTARMGIFAPAGISRPVLDWRANLALPVCYTALTLRPPRQGQPVTTQHQARSVLQATPRDPGPMGPTRLLLSKPVIAAVGGAAVAGGMELALWCDMRVMEEDAYFGVYCRRFGVPLIDGGTVRLPRLIGIGHALDLILTGRKVEAAEALQMGLANRVVPAGAAREAAVALARQLATFPQATMLSDRMNAYEQWDLSLPEALHLEWERSKHRIPDALEGAARFAGGEGRHGKF